MIIKYLPHMQAYKATYGKMILSAGIDRAQVITDALRRLKAKKILLLRD
jgi:hypothetical protein